MQKSVNMRSMKAELSCLYRCDGSASFSIGDSAVLVGIMGPGDLKMSKQQGDKLAVEVVYTAKVTSSSALTHSNPILEEIVREAVGSAVITRLFPRAGLTVAIQELHDDGSLHSAAVNGVCLALLDAGLPMRNTFAAVNCCLGSEDELVLNPTTKEVGNSSGSALFIFDSLQKSLLTCVSSGKFSDEQFHRSLETCKTASDNVFSFYRTIVERKYSGDGDFISRPTFVAKKSKATGIH